MFRNTPKSHLTNLRHEVMMNQISEKAKAFKAAMVAKRAKEKLQTAHRDEQHAKRTEAGYVDTAQSERADDFDCARAWDAMEASAVKTSHRHSAKHEAQVARLAAAQQARVARGEADPEPIPVNDRSHNEPFPVVEYSPVRVAPDFDEE
jgi:hypothetical protein